MTFDIMMYIIRVYEG